MTISLETARAIVAEARVAARRAQLQPITVVVLDDGGKFVAGEREDGSSLGRFELAHGKAHGALALGMGSRALMMRAEQQPFFLSAIGRVVGPMVPVPGGVLVLSDAGTIEGAVGVSGDLSDNDEAVAIAGIRACGLAGQAD